MYPFSPRQNIDVSLISGTRLLMREPALNKVFMAMVGEHKDCAQRWYAQRW